MTRIVQSIVVPISQEIPGYSACAAPGHRILFIQLLHTRPLVTLCLSTYAHFSNIYSSSVSLELIRPQCLIASTWTLLSRQLFLRHPLDFPGMNDEALGRRTNKVEREARNKRQIVTA